MPASSRALDARGRHREAKVGMPTRSTEHAATQGIPYIQSQIFDANDYSAGQVRDLVDHAFVLTVPEIPGLPEMNIWRQRSIGRAATSFIALLLSTGTEEYSVGAWWIHAFVARLAVHGRIKGADREIFSLGVRMVSPLPPRNTPAATETAAK